MNWAQTAMTVAEKVSADRDVKPGTVKGRRFRENRREHYNQYHRERRKRIKAKLGLKRNGRGGVEVTWKGCTYPTIKECALANGLSEWQMRRRLGRTG